MIIKYLSHDGTVELTYAFGHLVYIFVGTDDKVVFDGIKHKIEFFEDDLDKTFFNQVWETQKTFTDASH